LPGADFAQIASQIDEAQISFLPTLFLLGKDLVDLAKNKDRAFEIELGWHERAPANPQVRQASQGRSLLPYG